MSSGRAQGSPSFMKSVFGTGWGKRAPGIGPQGQSISVDPRYSIDPGIFGPIVQGAKQVRQFVSYIKLPLCIHVIHCLTNVEQVVASLHLFMNLLCIKI